MGRSTKKMTEYNDTEKQIDNDIFIISESAIKTFNKKVRVVLDISVIVKWFFKDDEKNTKKADLILKQYLNNFFFMFSVNKFYFLYILFSSS